MSDQKMTMMDPPIESLMEKVGSKFGLVSLAASRGREINTYFNQLGEGLGSIIPPQVTSVSRKPLSIAFEEIAVDKIVPIWGGKDPITGKAITTEVIVGDAEVIVGDAEVVIGDAEVVIEDTEVVIEDTEVVNGDASEFVAGDDPVVADTNEISQDLLVGSDQVSQSVDTIEFDKLVEDLSAPLASEVEQSDVTNESSQVSAVINLTDAEEVDASPNEAS